MGKRKSENKVIGRLILLCLYMKGWIYQAPSHLVIKEAVKIHDVVNKYLFNLFHVIRFLDCYFFTTTNANAETVASVSEFLIISLLPRNTYLQKNIVTCSEDKTLRFLPVFLKERLNQLITLQAA